MYNLCINNPVGRQYYNTRKTKEPAQVKIAVTQIQFYTYRVDLETGFIAPQFLRTFQQCIADQYTTYVCCRKRS
jgi:hypothetical protein